MSFHYYKWMLIVSASETVGGKFEVELLDPSDHRPVVSKVFKRGADPSEWIGKQMAKLLPTRIRELHKWKNDDLRAEELREPMPVFDRYGYDDPYYNDWRGF